MAKIIKPLEFPEIKQGLTPELLGLIIKAKRTQSNLRLEDCASLCGVAKQTLMKIEHGSTNSQIGSIFKICDSLGIKLNFEDITAIGEIDEWQ